MKKEQCIECKTDYDQKCLCATAAAAQGMIYIYILSVKSGKFIYKVVFTMNYSVCCVCIKKQSFFDHFLDPFWTPKNTSFIIVHKDLLFSDAYSDPFSPFSDLAIFGIFGFQRCFKVEHGLKTVFNRL